MSRVTVIKPKTNLLEIDLKELWSYRELFYIFAWRDLKVRYKQTFFGAAWAIFQPLFSMFIFTIFFGNLAKIPSGELPYPLFVLIGLVFWGFFSNTLSHSSNSLIENEHIIKKVYFPRLILPLSTSVTSGVDFMVAFSLLIIATLYFGYIPHPIAILIIPLGLLIATIGASGVGLFLSALNVKYRDVRYILPFFIQTLVFLTPVIYPTTIMRPQFKYLMAINPMTGVIESIRQVFSGSAAIEYDIMAISATSATIAFLIGLYYFRRTERFFADIV
jgi:lipopolysaccharide transport system permease protein